MSKMHHLRHLRQGGMWISSSSTSSPPPRHPQLLIFPRLSFVLSFSPISPSLISVSKKTCHSWGWNSQPLDSQSKTLTTRPLGLLLYIALEVLWILESFAVPGEVSKWFLNDLVDLVVCYLPMLKVTVLETSTEMLSETYTWKQMPRFCLSCTVFSHAPNGDLNLYRIIWCWKVKLGSIPFVLASSRLIPVLPLASSTCLHVRLYSQLLLMDLWTVY